MLQCLNCYSYQKLKRKWYKTYRIKSAKWNNELTNPPTKSQDYVWNLWNNELTNPMLTFYREKVLSNMKVWAPTYLNRGSDEPELMDQHTNLNGRLSGTTRKRRWAGGDRSFEPERWGRKGERVLVTTRAGEKRIWGFNIWITQHWFL